MASWWLFLWRVWRSWLRRLFSWLHREPVFCGRRRSRAVSVPVFLVCRRKPAWVLHELVRLKARMPDAGCRRVADVFNRCFAARGMRVSKSHVACVLRQQRYAIEEERKRLRRRKPFNPAPNQVWAIDLTGKQDALGQGHSILGIIDHGTRRLLHLDVAVNKCAWTLLGHVFLAIGQYGKPKALRSDNEHVFTGRVFRLGLRLAGIRQQRTELGCPWQNGRIERLFGTLKEKLDQWCVENGAGLSSALNIFAHWYNAVRPHQNLNGRTPLEAWTGIDPYRSAPKQAVWFEGWHGLLTGVYLRR